MGLNRWQQAAEATDVPSLADRRTGLTKALRVQVFSGGVGVTVSRTNSKMRMGQQAYPPPGLGRPGEAGRGTEEVPWWPLAQPSRVTPLTPLPLCAHRPPASHIQRETPCPSLRVFPRKRSHGDSTAASRTSFSERPLPSFQLTCPLLDLPRRTPGCSGGRTECIILDQPVYRAVVFQKAVPE